VMLVAVVEVAAVAVLAAVVDVAATTVCCWLLWLSLRRWLCWRLGWRKAVVAFVFVMVEAAIGTCGCNVGGFGS
jgi:hypothetical protein